MLNNICICGNLFYYLVDNFINILAKFKPENASLDTMYLVACI